MPGGDGTGPMGYMTRRNRNFSRAYGRPIGCGFGRGFGFRRFGNYNPRFPEFMEDELDEYDISDKYAISREKDLLESRLEFLNTQLSKLKED